MFFRLLDDNHAGGTSTSMRGKKDQIHGVIVSSTGMRGNNSRRGRRASCGRVIQLLNLESVSWVWRLGIIPDENREKFRLMASRSFSKDHPRIRGRNTLLPAVDTIHPSNSGKVSACSSYGRRWFIHRNVGLNEILGFQPMIEHHFENQMGNEWDIHTKVWKIL